VTWYKHFGVLEGSNLNLQPGDVVTHISIPIPCYLCKDDSLYNLVVPVSLVVSSFELKLDDGSNCMETILSYFTMGMNEKAKYKGQDKIYYCKVKDEHINKLKKLITKVKSVSTEMKTYINSQVKQLQKPGGKQGTKEELDDLNAGTARQRTGLDSVFVQCRDYGIHLVVNDSDPVPFFVRP